MRALALLLALASCSFLEAKAAEELCVDEAAKANADCEKLGLKLCGEFKEDPSTCPDAADVDEACDRMMDAAMKECAK